MDNHFFTCNQSQCDESSTLWHSSNYLPTNSAYSPAPLHMKTRHRYWEQQLNSFRTQIPQTLLS